MSSLSRLLVYGGLCVVGAAAAVGSYLYFSRGSDEEEDEEAVEERLKRESRVLLLKILWDKKVEFGPVLLYYADLYEKKMQTEPFASSAEERARFLRFLNGKMHASLADAEQQACELNGLAYDQYQKLHLDFAQDPQVQTVDEEIKALVTTTAKGAKPEVHIDLPASLTADMYLKVFRRMTAMLRYSLYMKIRGCAMSQKHPPSQEQIHEIMKVVKAENARDIVCTMYKIEKAPDENYARMLRKAYYVHMTDPRFGPSSDVEKIYNDQLITAILNNWLIPEMELDPLSLTEDELLRRIEFQIAYVAPFLEEQRAKAASHKPPS